MLRTEFMKGTAAQSARRISSTFFTLLGIAALAAAVGVSLPAEAKKRRNAEKPVAAAIPDPADGEPMTLVVSLGPQKVDVYRGMTLIASSSVSTGMRGYATKAGVFSILEKHRHHHSNLYSGAPMPWMNRITWSGTALHAGVVPGYPASHGCIRLPFSFAPKLFKITTVGDNVIVARDRLAPRLIEHANLFQPLPPPAPPAMVRQEEPPKRQSRNEAVPMAPVKTHPGMLARAALSGSTTDVPSSLEAEAIGGAAASSPKEDPAKVEDTHAHAFDPFAGVATEDGSHDEDPTDHATNTSGHALDEANAPEPSLVRLAAAPAAPSPAPEAHAAAAISTPVESAAPSTAPLTEVPTLVAPKPAESTGMEAKPVEQASLAVEIAPTPAATTDPADQALTTPQAGATEASALPEANAPPSVVAAKLMAGAQAAAVLAAEPRSTAPLRILVTRRTQRDRIIGVQHIFAELGYLLPQDFDGTLGKATVSAIKQFQKANGMPETGAFNDELVNKVYAVSGKGAPPAGHLWVRQEFGRVFDVPVSFKDPETPLGTHIFTALKFAPGETSTRWMAMSLQGDDSATALDRLEIPNDLRQNISERLTPGSSLIIGDTAINSAALTKGADFLVWAKDMPAKITAASIDGDMSRPKPRKKKSRNVRRPSFDYSYRYPRGPGVSRGPSWPW